MECDSKTVAILYLFVFVAIVVYVVCRCIGDKTRNSNCYRKKIKTWKNED